MKTRYIGLAVALLWLAVIPGVVEASEHFHPKIKSGEIKIRSVMVLPVKAEVMKIGVSGTTQQPEQVGLLRDDATNALTKALVSRGLRLYDCPYTDAALRDDQELRARLADFESRYADLSVHLTRKPKDVEQGRYSLGDRVIELVPDTDADALVIVRASAYEKTGGMKLLTSSLGQGRHTDVTITLVDARSGEVLAHFQVGAGRNLDKAVAKAMQKLPR
jgi:hypothetical protein